MRYKKCTLSDTEDLFESDDLLDEGEDMFEDADFQEDILEDAGADDSYCF